MYFHVPCINRDRSSTARGCAKGKRERRKSTGIGGRGADQTISALFGRRKFCRRAFKAAILSVVTSSCVGTATFLLSSRGASASRRGAEAAASLTGGLTDESVRC